MQVASLETVLCACGLASQLTSKQLCPDCGERARVEIEHLAIMERVFAGELFDINPSRRMWLISKRLIRAVDPARSPRPDLDSEILGGAYDPMLAQRIRATRLRAMKANQKLRRFELTERGVIVREAGISLGISAGAYWDQEVLSRSRHLI